MYSNEASRSPIWQESHEVTPTDGFFSVMLGSKVDISLTDFDSGAVYLSIAVDREAESTRQLLGSVPFAIMASNAATANNLVCEGCITSRQLADGAVSQNKLAGGSSSSSGTTLTSSNGNYSLEVGNTGIVFAGPQGELLLQFNDGWIVESDDGLFLEASRDLSIASGEDLDIAIGKDTTIIADGEFVLETTKAASIKSDKNINIESAEDLSVKATTDLNLDGNKVKLNGACDRVARRGDFIGIGSITTGSETVSAC